MTDYRLSKMMFELQSPAVAAEFRQNSAAVIERYALKPDVRRAVLTDDVPALAKLVNPYLLRYYFGYRGMSDAEFIARLNGSEA